MNNSPITTTGSQHNENKHLLHLQTHLINPPLSYSRRWQRGSGGTTDNNQEVDTTQMPFDGWMDRQNVTCPNNGIGFSHRKRMRHWSMLQCGWTLKIFLVKGDRHKRSYTVGLSLLKKSEGANAYRKKADWWLPGAAGREGSKTSAWWIPGFPLGRWERLGLCSGGGCATLRTYVMPLDCMRQNG